MPDNFSPIPSPLSYVKTMYMPVYCLKWEVLAVDWFLNSQYYEMVRSGLTSSLSVVMMYMFGV